MKFEQIILGARLNASDYPNVSEINVNLFDSKNRLIEEEKITFHEPLFNTGSISYHNFVEFVSTKENFMILPESFDAKLTPDALIIHWPGKSAKIFLRF